MGATALTLTPPDGAWMKEAACAGRWTLMQGTEDGDVEAAKALCESCPVWEACRAWVLSLPPREDVEGVAGGLTRDERDKIRRRIRRAKAPEPPRACTRCGDVKSAEDFYRRPTYPSGRESQCRNCCMERNRISKAAKRAAAKLAKDVKGIAS